MDIVQKIKDLITSVIVKMALNYEENEIVVIATKDRQYGNFSTNILFSLAKQNNAQIEDLGNALIENINDRISDYPEIQKVEIKNKGYINFYLKDTAGYQVLSQINMQKENYGKNSTWQGQAVVLEYTDPNPFKVFHIGHLMTNTIGEALSRLVTVCGADVRRANYQGDVGMHVAKSIWGMLDLFEKEKLNLSIIEAMEMSERISFLGRAYAVGATAFETDEGVVDQIKQINLYVYLAAQQYLQENENWQPQIDYSKLVTIEQEYFSQIKSCYFAGRLWSLAYFETIYRLLGTKFDAYYFESKVGEYGLQIVKEHVKDGIFEPSNGAYIFVGEKYGLHTRVFVNSFGLPVYECKDLALALMKKQDYPYTKSIIVTGNEINEYFQVVLKALNLINPEIAAQTVHLGHGMLRLKSGKMSSRTGKVISAMELFDEIKKQVGKIMTTGRGLTSDERVEVNEKTTIAAWKYSVLKQKVGHDIVFDFGESVSLEGNSGPYLLYTYARAKSILAKSGFAETSISNSPGELLPIEREILQKLGQFPAVIIDSAQKYAPHTLCNYLFKLAQDFNSYYGSTQILVENADVSQFRLQITRSVSWVIKNGLSVLGIDTVEKM